MTASKPERKRLGGFDKVLIGCGLGCAALILGAVLLGAFGAMWIFTPGEQAVTDAIADDRSLGVIRMREMANDPGTQELLTRVLQRINEAQREQQREELPPSMRWISDLQNQQANPGGINMLIPKQMTIAYEENADGTGLDYVVAVNPRAMVRMFKAMFSLISRADDAGEMRADYLGYDAYKMDDDGYLAFVRSTVLYASSRRALERAIDRLEEAAAGGAPATDVPRSSFYSAGSIPEGDWDIEGAVSNEAGLVDLFLQSAVLESADAPAGVDAEADELEAATAGGARSGTFETDEGCPNLGFGFDIVSADEITGRAVLDCGDESAAQHWLAVLEKRYAAMTEKAKERGQTLEIEVREDGRRVVTEVRLLGVEAMLVEAFTGSGGFEEEPEGEVEE